MRLSGAPARPEHGSALALVPAMFVVALLLGAIACDAATATLGQRRLADAVDTAAADAATGALSPAEFYRDGRITIDAGRAARVVCESVAAQHDGALHALTLKVAIAGPAIAVDATALVARLFGRPFASPLEAVHARAEAVAATNRADLTELDGLRGAPLLPITC